MTRLASLIGAFGLMVGCGGDDEGTPDIDAAMHDAEVPDGAPPDTSPPAATVSGTIAVTDIVLDHPAAQANNFRGGAISIGFSDLTVPDRGGTEVFRGSDGAPVGSCLITQFGPTSGLPYPSVDAGAVTVAGAGLNRTVGPCTFSDAAQSYLCVSHDGVDQSAIVTDDAGGPGTAAYTFPAGPFPATANSLQGSYLVVNGFDDAGNNSGASAFPIVAQPNTTTVVVANANAVTVGAPEADIAYSVLNGFAPVPNGPDFLVADADVTVTKGDSAVWPAIDLTTDVMGDGFALDGVSDDPSGFPTATVTEPLEYSCDNDTPADPDDDTCGDDSTTTLKAFILSGRATQKPVAGLLPFQMPTEDGTTEWMEWQCAILFGKSVTMPVEAVNTIVDFSPTRVEMRVLNVAGHLVNEPDPGAGPNAMRVLVGHGIVGHTDGAP